ncbi:glycosyl hydrolase [Roseibacillus persicicus]|uniref:glycosyl hydrolase n=1 Tax=Roseibacillus persicicus TaxID=454148 RepID=UPI00398BB50F
MKIRFSGSLTFLAVLFSCAPDALLGREWTLKEVPQPVELKILTQKGNAVLVEDELGAKFELPVSNFSKADQQFLRLLGQPAENKIAILAPGKPLPRGKDFQTSKAETLTNQFFTPKEATVLHLTGSDENLLAGSSFNFVHGDGWVVFEKFKPSVVRDQFLDRMLVNGAVARLGKNIRIEPYGVGAVVIPHGPDFPALTLFENEHLKGKEQSFTTYQKTGSDFPASSFVLKRGYMATLAENADGTGASRNFVAQDHDLVINKMPEELAGKLGSIRVFPWRWTTKKGICGDIVDNLDLGWYYNWNLNKNSTLDLEYVPIKQKRHWPGLNQDWKTRGSTHLLGFNEPDRPDQANMSVDAAISAWPELMNSGLRLGSPSVSDGGLGWLYEFMDKADKKGLRVDFVVIHYYRAVNKPGDGRAAASQFYKFIENVHERTKRPIWVKEWNNGANWTSAPDPSPTEQKRAIAAMIEMLEETPFVERYALYNWVEPSRELVRKDGSLTPAGEVYRDLESTISYQQERP